MGTDAGAVLGTDMGVAKMRLEVIHVPFKLPICLMAVQTQEMNLCAHKKLEVESEGHPALLKSEGRPEIGGPEKI